MVPSATSTGPNHLGPYPAIDISLAAVRPPRNWSERWHAYSRDLLAGASPSGSGSLPWARNQRQTWRLHWESFSNDGAAAPEMRSLHCANISFCKTMDRCMISRERKSSVAACSVLPVEPRPNKEDTFNVEAEELVVCCAGVGHNGSPGCS